MRKNKFFGAAVVLCAALAVSGCSEAEKLQPENTSADTSVTTEAAITTTTTATTVATTTTPVTTTTTEPEETPAPSEEPGNVPDDYREYGENNILIIGRNGHYMGLMGCWGTFELCDNYVSCVEKAAEKLPDVNVYNMIIPTSVEFYLPDDVSGYSASQKEKIDYIADGLSKAVSVDAYSALEEHKEEPVYTRTDHHWQPLGAYYAAEAFAKTAGVDDLFPALTEYEKVTREGYVGSMYNYSKSVNLYNDPEPFDLYISPNADALTTTYYDTSFQNGSQGHLFTYPDASGYYLSFLGTDICIAEIDTDCKNGKTLVVCKESYGNALIPFLTECYEKIYVTDLRYFDLELTDFCKEVGATDLLFAMCTFTPAGANCSCMNAIIK